MEHTRTESSVSISESEEHPSYIQQEPEQWSQPDAYMVTMPHDTPSVYPGRTQAVIALVCGIASIGIAPLILGPAGIVLGFVARKKGARTLGTNAAWVALVSMIVGIAIEVLLAAGEQYAAGFIGAVRWFF